MWFIKKVIILNYGDDQIIVGNTYREDMNPSVFQIYFPNQVKTTGFNFNPEFSKALIALDHFNSPGPILSITLNKKNIDKFIKEDDIIFENTMDTSRGFKPLNFQQPKVMVLKSFSYLNTKIYLLLLARFQKAKKIEIR